VDFLVEGRVIVELDGGEFRSSKAQFQRDRERTNAAQIAGFTCLRFTRADILHCPDEFARTVAEAVKRAPGPPRPR
jgi:very-short-patch-repair endonuclease